MRKAVIFDFEFGDEAFDYRKILTLRALFDYMKLSCKAAYKIVSMIAPRYLQEFRVKYL
ncbi:hypothetical protein Cpap_3293 [Ruminiclostridium papyrosolvens DSM 2782]|uniref:Uncharacterized protein n=1 Tax=Ruminiclostridium papyrosolvens DSM 2782 TaxID=588581 RepID=F1T8N5_9FIRM|nr:hypothetical protein [Ruminiclostridium papyrosolvens]EGD48867.1 hypothetical protein Cpap_3293 [Ruminiclostridium papyrosolvens DSM 2782]WES35353.1 hypothetical protein P0092_05090 [Ruminiclostridium papyrosolvens DSM 2782]